MSFLSVACTHTWFIPNQRSCCAWASTGGGPQSIPGPARAPAGEQLRGHFTMEEGRSWTKPKPSIELEMQTSAGSARVAACFPEMLFGYSSVLPRAVVVRGLNINDV